MPRKGVKMSDEAKKKNAEAIRRWQKDHTEALSIRVRKEKADAYRELAHRRGQSLSSIIWQHLDSECRKEGIAVDQSAR